MESVGWVGLGLMGSRMLPGKGAQPFITALDRSWEDGGA